MGSACCVAAKPLEPTDTRSAWSNGGSETHWSSNGNFSPLGSHWSDKDISRNFVGAVHDFQFHGASFSSSSRGSRSGSRAASSRFTVDQRKFPGCMFSQVESPLNSFHAAHWNPLATSHMYQSSDFNRTPETFSSPTVTVASSKEACLSETNTPELTPQYSRTRENLQSSAGQLQLQRHGNHLYCSKSLPPSSSHALTRSGSNSRIHATAVGSRNSITETRHSFKYSDRGEDFSGSSSDWWSMRTFSELVASSQRDRPCWTSASSPSDFGFVPEKISADRSDSRMERIRAAGPPASTSPPMEAFICGLCSKWLSQSPLSTHRLMASNDLAVVSVLCCGHVFHAECLEQTTPKGAHDPLCPQCQPLETSATSGSLESGASKSVPKSGFQGQPPSRNKLSRIGIITDDSSIELHPDICHPGKKSASYNQGTGDKLVNQISFLVDKSSLSKSLSRTFSFKGKGAKDPTWFSLNTKKMHVPNSISPECNPIEDLPKTKHIKRALKYLQLPVQKVASRF